MALFSTRIVDLTVPDVAPVGEPVFIKGALQWYCPWCIDLAHPFGQWMPLEGETVELHIDGVKTDTAITSGGGAFTFERVFNEKGTYSVKVRYPGSFKNNECWSSERVIKVVSKDEYDDYMNEKTLMYALIGVASFAAVMSLVAVISR